MSNQNKQPVKIQTKPSGLPFGGPGKMMQSVQKARDFKGTMKKLAGYLKIYRVSIFLVCIFAITSTIFSILSPKIMGGMTNQIVNDLSDKKAYEQNAKTFASKNKQPSINFKALLDAALLLLGLYFLSSFLEYVQGWIMSGITQKVTYNLRRQISEKINRLPLKYFDKNTHGDILSRVINDVDTVSQTLNQSLTQIITSLTLIFGILIMMFMINWIMTLVSLLIVPLSFGVIGKIIKKSQKHFKRQQDSLGEINGHIEEMYAGHKVMKVFDGEERSLEKFRKINNEMYDSAWKSQFLSGLMYPIMNFMSNLSFVGVSVVGGWLAIRGSINIGDIQAFIQYIRLFNQPIMQTANMANILQSTAAAAERVFEFLDEEDELPDSPEAITIKNIRGQVELENVNFAYNQEKMVIKNLSIKIQPGQKVAIVGPTGAGKTTIVNLLMRFYEINDGVIKIDGFDIRTLKRSNLRRMFGMVLQDTWLFKGTIKENIGYGKQDASEQEVITVAETARIDQLIRTLPQGYDTELNEQADNVSQGEKQLITIARAMLSDPAILILDEATSSVDTRTEVLIQDAMEKLMKNRTSFVIAHRLSTIRDADLILVMNNGQFIEHGRHQELLAQNGFYASLYQSQFTPAENKN